MIGSGKTVKSKTAMPPTPSTVKGSKKRKEQFEQPKNSNLKMALYIILGVLFLNIVLQIFTP